MKKLISILCICLFSTTILYSQDSTKQLKVYLIPGQGSDYRIFQNLTFPDHVDTIHLSYLLPDENETMPSFALRMSEQIDTTQKFAIIGVSLGGMLACEMTNFMHPEKVIIISSAKSADELPPFYKKFKPFPIHEHIAPGIFKSSTFILQPVYEHDRELVKDTCLAMLHDKDPLFIKRATHCIVTWERTAGDNSGKNIIHIHGDADNTLSIKNITADHVIQNGSHLMTLTRSEEISVVLKIELKNIVNK